MLVTISHLLIFFLCCACPTRITHSQDFFIVLCTSYLLITIYGNSGFNLSQFYSQINILWFVRPIVLIFNYNK
jgi:hypothetical protein